MCVGVEVTEKHYVIVIFKGVTPRQRVVDPHLLFQLFLLFLIVINHIQL